MGVADFWFKFYTNDFLGGTQTLDAEGTGCYLLLMIYSWMNGPVPLDLKKTMRIAKLFHGDQQVVLEEILELHWIKTKDGYINKRLEKERKSAQLRADASRSNGTRGGRPKEPSGGPSNNLVGSLVGNQVGGPDPNLEKSLSVSVSISDTNTESDTVTNSKKGGASRFTPPTLEQVFDYGVEFCQSKGFPRFKKSEAERIVDHYASNGWKVGGKAVMKDWQASIRNWIRRDAPTSVIENKEIDSAQRRREEERQALAAEKAGVEIPSVMGAIFAAKKGAAA